MSLHSGERQVAPGLSGIRRDHVARYEFARSLIPGGSAVIDVACGVGYGSALLADAGHAVTAYDRSPDAIGYALEHYRRENVTYRTSDVSDGVEFPSADVAVSFETIEHLADPRPMLRALCSAAPMLIASVPNEAVFPYRGQLFHHRHYTKPAFARLLDETGWQVTGWFGQAGPESEVEADIQGRTLIAVCRRKPDGARVSVDEDAPGHVAIVGLGPSFAVLPEMSRRLGGISAYCDEVWGINAVGDVLRCDRVFHMDDVRIQELRAEARPGGNIAAMLRWMRVHPGPIYTSVVRPGYPGLVPFPLEEVLNAGHDSNGGAPYFNNTAAYAIAFAVHIGVKRVSLFGIDFTRPNAHEAEQGRACCEFWLGIAAARGIEITVPEQSTLMDACAPEAERLYGYDCVDVTFREGDDGRLKVMMAERAEIPTAAEIERRYDHTRHPNRIVQKETESCGQS